MPLSSEPVTSLGQVDNLELECAALPLEMYSLLGRCGKRGAHLLPHSPPHLSKSGWSESSGVGGVCARTWQFDTQVPSHWQGHQDDGHSGPERPGTHQLQVGKETQSSRGIKAGLCTSVPWRWRHALTWQSLLQGLLFEGSC